MLSRPFPSSMELDFRNVAMCGRRVHTAQKYTKAAILCQAGHLGTDSRENWAFPRPPQKLQFDEIILLHFGTLPMKTLSTLVALLAIVAIGCSSASTADSKTDAEGSSTVYEGDFKIVTVDMPGMT